MNVGEEQNGVIVAQYVSGDMQASDFDNAAWESASPLHLTRYWSGEEAPFERRAEARVVWSSRALGVRFTCRQAEPLIVGDSPQCERKTPGLWDRDVCEIFIAPDALEIERYFEFEVAPTGEWLDLAIRQLPDRRETDWAYRSGIEAAARVEEGRIMLAMRLPWEAFGNEPQPDERWRANLFRCIGTGPNRGYLAWRPTHTERPNFHVPPAFGWLHFGRAGASPLSEL